MNAKIRILVVADIDIQGQRELAGELSLVIKYGGVDCLFTLVADGN